MAFHPPGYGRAIAFYYLALGRRGPSLVKTTDHDQPGHTIVVLAQYIGNISIHIRTSV